MKFVISTKKTYYSLTLGGSDRSWFSRLLGLWPDLGGVSRHAASRCQRWWHFWFQWRHQQAYTHNGWLSKHTKAQRTILKTYKIATYNAQNLQNRPGRGQPKRTKAQRTKSQRTKVYRPMGKAYNGKSNNDQNVQNWNVQWQIKQTRIIQNCNLQNEMIVSYKIASSKIGRYKMPLVDAGWIDI